MVNPSFAIINQLPHNDAVEWPTNTWPENLIEIDDEKFRAIINYTFSDNSFDELGRTNALLIIQDGSIVHVTHKSQYSDGCECHIGSDVTIGHGCIIHACTIEDMALVGMGSVILDGSTISKKVMIGAKSLVPSGKTLESGYLYMGSPCKKIRPLKDGELEFLKYSATHYVNTKNDFLSQS